MPSIYQRALGADFARLHPQVQRRFGFGAAEGVRAIGTGVMDEIWHGAWYTLPFLAFVRLLAAGDDPRTGDGGWSPGIHEAELQPVRLSSLPG